MTYIMPCSYCVPLAMGHLGREPPCSYMATRELTMSSETWGCRRVKSGVCVLWVSQRERSL